MAHTNSNSTSNSTSFSSDTNASIQNVKDDLRTLKTDVVGLGMQAHEEGKKYLNDATETVQKKLKAVGGDEISAITAYIKDKPAQSIAWAFGAGFIASFLFGRR